ncbi:MAG: pyruvate, phosphate dikinase [Chloroflexota bacterium]|nr:pyruvate, phosphate dikinase [Dehalococcoidia bacterium]MDW8255192.1 pyruvate, phosphate dikinase [Chloroflexota bacterium]
MVSAATGTKWVYLFHEGNASMRDLLGGKGAGLAEMTNAGLPVPPGFTITTSACVAYTNAGGVFPPGMWEQTLEALHAIEQATGKRFGDPANPLLLSVRSGAKFSMPGMMDTVLNLGLNEETLQGLIALTGNPRFGYDAWRRFLQMFGKVVLDIPAERFEAILEEVKRERGAALDTDLTADALRDVAERYLACVREVTGKEFPRDPFEQLRLAIEAVFHSWNNPRAVAYREFNKIPHDLGTAVNIQTMVFGNMGDDSGSGVAFTRNPATGERRLYGELLFNAQGEDVVAGIRTPKRIDELEGEFPALYRQLVDIAERLERHYRDAQDLEFTIERGTLYMLQTRAAKRTAAAAVKMAVDMVGEGLITKQEAVQRVEPEQVVQLLMPRFDEQAKAAAIAEGRLLATGLNASPGAATGLAVLSADKAVEWANRGRRVVLVRPETNPDDVHGMIVAEGVLTARGGATSHAAVVARGLGKPCVAGTEALHVDTEAGTFGVDGRLFREGEEISIDGTTGEVFIGRIPTIDQTFAELTDLRTLLEWADEIRRLGVWANADYPRDADRAVQFGAEGIGLCRTEHMFFEEERLPLVRQMILHARDAQAELDRIDALPPSERAAARARLREHEAVRLYLDALHELERVQTDDFRGIFRVMAGRPTVIRLLDPPLHEFLPRYEDLLRQIEHLEREGGSADELAELRKTLATVEELREANPMLGLRGCRLGILYPDIYAMQVRAILNAAADLIAEHIPVRAEIMIPLVGHVNELKVVRDRLEAVAREVQEQRRQTIPYKFGTMIEVPRAALTADEIAPYAEFFSFGTNDLTQMTLAISRDDAEGKFLMHYVNRKILPVNPFQQLDQAGVGKLITLAVKEGRRVNPNLQLGVCGEHGGDPASIAFFHAAGLDYVSCSPFRVPVARLAAAQAALSAHERDR